AGTLSGVTGITSTASYSIDLNAAAPTTLTLTNSDAGPGNVASLLVEGSGTFGTGLTVTSGGATVAAGNLAVAAGKITLGAAASQLVPGVTSFAIRNSADSADNLLVTDAGAVTVRNGLAVTSGGATIAAGGLAVSAGGASIVGGIANNGGGISGAGTLSGVTGITSTASYSIDLNAAAPTTLTLTNSDAGPGNVANLSVEGSGTFGTGLTVTSGGATIAAGGLNVSGGIANGAAPTAGQLGGFGTLQGAAGATALTIQGVAGEAAGDLVFKTVDNAGALQSRLAIGSGAASAAVTWSGVTQSGLVLGGALDANGQNLTNLATLRSGGAQDLTLDSGTNRLAIAGTNTALQRIAAGPFAIDLKDAAATTLQVLNSTPGQVANLDVAGTGTFGTGLTVAGGPTTLNGAVNVNTTSADPLRVRDSTGTTARAMYVTSSLGGATCTAATPCLAFESIGFAPTNNIAAIDGTGTFVNASDARLKANIAELSYGLGTVLRLQPRSYTMGGIPQIGFVAQEVEPVVPEVVGEIMGQKTLAYGNLVAVAINASRQLASILDVAGAGLAGPTMRSIYEVAGKPAIMVDAQGNVGLGTVTPSSRLEVVGSLTSSGPARFGSTLSAAGDLTVGADRLRVAAETGNTSVGGELWVAAATRLGGSLDVAGATTLRGTLAVSGATALGSNLAVTGHETLGGNLAVNGGNLTTSASTFNLANEAATLNIGSTDTTRTVNIATGRAADVVNIATGGGSDLVTIGSNSAKVAITGDRWSINAAGAASFSGLIGPTLASTAALALTGATGLAATATAGPLSLQASAGQVTITSKLRQAPGAQAAVVINYAPAVGEAFSDAGDLLLDVQNQGASKLRVNKDGDTTVAGNLTARSLRITDLVFTNDFRFASASSSSLELLSPAGRPMATFDAQGNVAASGAGSFKDLVAAGSLTIGNGGATAAIKGHLSATESLDFPPIAPNTCEERTIRVEGAATGDTVVVGPPPNLPSPVAVSALVVSSDTIAVRLCHVRAPDATGDVSSIDPLPGTYRVDVWKH
ncbi:MAG: tail fiber domain-containing protein, partial [Chloroflexi bacterium]|nr:tail fiber domain-containing protein [Chloroflexota bacterium]